ncbi:MAG: nucleoside 2-deoxyribosyltransferase domain-containing protein [Candidatus Taylorbacteria bacterium]|nr:nucleoside 2-deoxyribosyltransferase domain-containing protein [Candidatus Taylorbacteria bacterium]
MQIVYNLEKPPESFSKSIFLAGPTPRSTEVRSWRPQALELLEIKKYDGVVYVPEERPSAKNTVIPENGYPEWEHSVMDKSDLILFWAERDMTLSPEFVAKLRSAKPEEISSLKAELKMPAFTTNIEYGLMAHSGKSLFGPIHGDKNQYLGFVADKFHIPQCYTLEGMINKALFEILKDGALRTGGEREVPLFIWRLRAFQNWYQAHKNAGNRLDGAKVEWLSRVRNKPEAIFAFALRPNVFIANENRNKVNDPVVFRLDISSIVLYKKSSDIMESEVVLIKEFRTAASTKDGFIWELPGGSSPYITNPLAVAVEEIREEVGLYIVETDRLRHVASRQMAGTLSAHKSHTYSVELMDEELEWLKSQKGIPHGSDYPDNPTGERAYTEVVKLRDIMYNNLVDFANVGMIRSVL